MPSNLVINRRSASRPAAGGVLRRRNFYVSAAAESAVADRAASLHVSQGSLVDTALQLVASLPAEEIAALLRAYGHLDEDQFEHVRTLGQAAEDTIDLDELDESQDAGAAPA